MLERTIAAYDLTGRVVPHHVAIGASPGVAQVAHCATHPADHRVVTTTLAAHAAPGSTYEEVTQLSLDAFVATTLEDAPVGFVKIDVQGYEPAVIAGMTQLCRRERAPVIAVEFSPAHLRELGFDGDAVFPDYPSAGYRRLALDRRGSAREIGDDELSAVVDRRGYADLLFVRR
jgi:FkbM family methyltransferase